MVNLSLAKKRPRLDKMADLISIFIGQRTKRKVNLNNQSKKMRVAAQSKISRSTRITCKFFCRT